LHSPHSPSKSSTGPEEKRSSDADMEESTTMREPR
jgi:hypothetical protein